MFWSTGGSVDGNVLDSSVEAGFKEPSSDVLGFEARMRNDRGDRGERGEFVDNNFRDV
jgi:hypothetical protein